MVFMLLIFTSTVKAALVNNGGGLIYDTDFNITWAQPTTTLSNWYDANAWATGLTLGGVTGWRLPSALNQDGSGPVDNYNVTTSEMGHLFYIELGNIGVIDPHGGPNWPAGWGLTHKGPFPNLQWSIYWATPTWGGVFPGCWYFDLADGNHGPGSQAGQAYA